MLLVPAFRGPAPPPAPSRGGGAPLGGTNSMSKQPPGTVSMSRVAQLKEMGFSDEVAKRALAECAWDVNAAIDRLLSSGAMSIEADSSTSGQAPPPVPAVEPASLPDS